MTPPRLSIVQPNTAAFLASEAKKAAYAELDEMLVAADRLQDRINSVLPLEAIPPGIRDAIGKFQAVLIAMSNNVSSLAQRAR